MLAMEIGRMHTPAVVILGLVVAFLAIAWPVAGLSGNLAQGPSAAGTDLVAIAAIVVSAATLTSVLFAVVSYLEASVFQARVDRARGEIEQYRAEANREISQLRDASYEIGLEAIKSHLSAVMSIPDSPQFQSSIQNLQRAQVKVQLAHGSRDSLERAIELAFKLPGGLFLEIQPSLWRCTERLSRADGEIVRNQYLNLQRSRLRALGF